jgi:hypothetical protein
MRVKDKRSPLRTAGVLTKIVKLFLYPGMSGLNTTLATNDIFSERHHDRMSDDSEKDPLPRKHSAWASLTRTMQS